MLPNDILFQAEFKHRVNMFMRYEDTFRIYYLFLILMNYLENCKGYELLVHILSFFIKKTRNIYYKDEKSIEMEVDILYKIEVLTSSIVFMTTKKVIILHLKTSICLAKNKKMVETI